MTTLSTKVVSNSNGLFISQTRNAFLLALNRGHKSLLHSILKTTGYWDDRQSKYDSKHSPRKNILCRRHALRTSAIVNRRVSRLPKHFHVGTFTSRSGMCTCKRNIHVYTTTVAQTFTKLNDTVSECDGNDVVCDAHSWSPV